MPTLWSKTEIWLGRGGHCRLLFYSFFCLCLCVRVWRKLCHRGNAVFSIDCPPGHATESCNTTFNPGVLGVHLYYGTVVIMQHYFRC